MPKIEKLLKRDQPKVYRQLLELRQKLKDQEGQDDERKLREIEGIMRHDAYERRRGGLRQTRRG
jgi:hypothetical protein